MRISDWRSDVCSSDLGTICRLIRRDLSKLSLDTPLSEIEPGEGGPVVTGAYKNMMAIRKDGRGLTIGEAALLQATTWWSPRLVGTAETIADGLQDMFENNCCDGRSEEHTSELQSLMRISYAVFCLKKKKQKTKEYKHTHY